MATAQLNARLDADLKRSGEATLARHGVSATEAIRALWDFLARTNEIPEYMKKQHRQEPVASCVNASVMDGAGLAIRLALEHGLAAPMVQETGYEVLRDQAFEEMVEEGAFHA